MAFVYSCCFWFSLRLGGILIGIFSLALFILIITCLFYKHCEQVKNVVTDWLNNLQLGYYIKIFLQNLIAEPERHFSISMSLVCIYIVVCCLFIYGAYMCHNMFMTPYLLMEASRLVVLSTVIAYFLLLLKENTMDIGLLIGASVAGGFLLLGMFYLWVCALNLPVLINEMKLDEQAATISKLQQLLEVNNQQGVNRDDLMEYGCGVVSNIPRSMFFVQRH